MKFKKLTAMAMTAVMLASGTAFADGVRMRKQRNCGRQNLAV